MSFELLPSEIKTEIFGQIPETSLIGNQLNRKAYSAASKILLRDICTRPISEKEIRAYIATQPRLIGIVESDISWLKIDDLHTTVLFLQNYSDNPAHAEWAHTYINLYEDQSTEYTELSYQGSNETHGWENEELFKVDTVYNITFRRPGSTLDLVSMYRILSKRLGCIKLDPNFAKQYVLDKFEQIVTATPSILYPLYLHIYLLMYVWIFNLHFESIDIFEPFRIFIDEQTGELYSEDDEDVLNDVKERNGILIPEIRKHLSIL